MVQTLIAYRHLGTFEALMSGLRLAVPDHPAVDDVEQLLEYVRFRTS